MQSKERVLKNYSLSHLIHMRECISLYIYIHFELLIHRGTVSICLIRAVQTNSKGGGGYDFRETLNKMSKNKMSQKGGGLRTVAPPQSVRLSA